MVQQYHLKIRTQPKKLLHSPGELPEGRGRRGGMADEKVTCGKEEGGKERRREGGRKRKRRMLARRKEGETHNMYKSRKHKTPRELSDVLALPGCGSQCVSPRENTIKLNKFEIVSPTARGSIPLLLNVCTSVTFTPSMYSIVSTRVLLKSHLTCGMWIRLSLSNNFPTRSPFVASCIKSSSKRTLSSSSGKSHVYSQFVNSVPTTVANTFSVVKSVCT